jgi:2-keto-4-pentenoate hydratase/2-oxohepta-3-ene-1,7-dioic acid hydratase in catechol pathway
VSAITRLFRAPIDGQTHYVAEVSGQLHLVEGDPFGQWSAGRVVEPPARWLAPIRPGKIVGIGRNYRDHAAERAKPVPAEPMVFLKPPSAVIGPGETIVLPPGIGRVDYEGELGVVIGRRGRHVPRARAADHVFGLTCVNDVTARALQDRGVQFSHAKGYDTFAPIGPSIEVAAVAAGLERDVECLVNGEVRQRGSTRDLIFPIDELIAYVSAIMTLEPGDVIATGTPAGISPLAPGDVVTVRVQGVGELTNPVAA